MSYPLGARRCLRALQQLCMSVAVFALTMAVPALAQDQRTSDPASFSFARPVPSTGDEAGASQVADSTAGRAGQRRTRDQAAGIAPMARINNRIQNRIQNRIRNRIGPGYDPTANATSPFEIAADRTRSAGRGTRR